jgi:hypothetical protein
VKFQLPFVSRERYDEALGRIAALEKESHRLLDLIFKNNFGVQLHDTLLQEQAQTEVPERELTDAEKAEQGYQSARERDISRLRSIKRTNPSRLGPELQRAKAAEIMRRAQAARPTHMTTHPAVAIFEQAKKEVTN